MKVVVDESALEDLADFLPGHDAKSVGQLGWKGTQNGALLKLVESVSAEAFITADKSLQNQQVLAGRPFAVLLLSTNNWQLIQKNLPEIMVALEVCQPGVVLPVECGRFISNKRRRREGLSLG